MLAIVAALIAVFSSAAVVVLWFWSVNGELIQAINRVESAKKQVLLCRNKCAQVSLNDEEKAVLLRSEDIYKQALARYHSMLCKKKNFIPAKLMGFRRIEGSEVLF